MSSVSTPAAAPQATALSGFCCRNRDICSRSHVSSSPEPPKRPGVPPLTLPSAPGGGTTVGASAPAGGMNGLAPVVLVASSSTGAAAAGCAPSSATRTTPSTIRSSARTDTDVMTARRESRTSSSGGGGTCGFVISWPPGSAGWQSCRAGDHSTVAGAPTPRAGYASWQISGTCPASSLFQPLQVRGTGTLGHFRCATSRSPFVPLFGAIRRARQCPCRFLRPGRSRRSLAGPSRGSSARGEE